MLIIPDLFTPYLQGTEMGRQANWDDLNQYNKVQAGQLKNMFDLATFSPRTNAFYDAETAAKLNNQYDFDTYGYNVNNSYAGARSNQMALEAAEAGHPGNLALQDAMSGAMQQGAGVYSQAQVDALIQEARNRAMSNQWTADWWKGNLGQSMLPNVNGVPGATTSAHGIVPAPGAAGIPGASVAPVNPIAPPAGLPGVPNSPVSNIPQVPSFAAAGHTPTVSAQPTVPAIVPQQPQATTPAQQQAARPQFPQIQMSPQYMNSPDVAGMTGRALRPVAGVQPGNGLFSGIVESSATRDLANNLQPAYRMHRDEMTNNGYTTELAATLQPDTWATLGGNQLAYRDANGDYWGMFVKNDGSIAGAYRVVFPDMPTAVQPTMTFTGEMGD